MSASVAVACDACRALATDLHGDGTTPYDLPTSYLPASLGASAGPESLAVPVYNSRPGAAATLYLDFDGVNFGATAWAGSGTSGDPFRYPGVRPAYSIDGDAANFSSTELANIYQIWSRTAEAYSQFDLNVTTVNPGNYNAYESAHVVISGDNTWFGGGGGVAYVPGFQLGGMVYNTGWVFEDNLGNGNPKFTADAAIHEAGHMFSLWHQSIFNASGTKTSEYDGTSGAGTVNTSLYAPNMGVSYNDQRGLWAQGRDNTGTFNFDISDIADDNGFGYVPDEAGIDTATAPAVSLSLTPQRGVIQDSADIDFYKLVLASVSDVSLFIDVNDFGPMMDVKLSIYDAASSLIAVVDPALDGTRDSLTAEWTALSLAAGTYFFSVETPGLIAYQNGNSTRYLETSGQYFIVGEVLAVPEPSLFAAAIALSLIGLRRRRA
jgi:hypothetical protein